MLKNFQIDIKAGSKIGLVGHSGCGKSTLTNLLLRFYDLDQGKIMIDGIPLNDYDIAALRKQIGYVMQEPVLFNESIKENILFGDLGCSDAKVRQVAEMANALQFIESNFEELKEHEQLEVVRREINQQSTKLSIPELTELSKLADLKALMITKFAIENGDVKFFKFLKDNSQFFIDIIKDELCGQSLQGMKWDDLILRTEWKWSIIQGLEQDSELDGIKEDVISLTVSHPQMFDLETIR